MTLCDKSVCTGCAACLNACPFGAIVFEPNAEGFGSPIIQESKCINCGKCKSACPQIAKISCPTETKRVFACWHIDKNIRRQSTSGGAFTALAEDIIRQCGNVYGAAFDGFPKVSHVCVDSIEGLRRFQGSKYVQSEIGRTFSAVKSDIQKGRRVLFSGTPCQVAGLYAFLGKRHEELLTTVDLVCHGVPSPMVFKDYVQWVERKTNAAIDEYHFRDKDIGWYLHSTKIKFSNGRWITENFFKNPYFRGFLRNYFLRQSCHSCQYAGLNRPADITLADFWGYQGKRKDGQDRDEDKGVSMVMLNTRAGAALFDSVKNSLIVWERSLDEAVRGNPALVEPFQPSPLREQFWTDYQSMPFDTVVAKYMQPDKLTGWWIERYAWYGNLYRLKRLAIGKCKLQLKRLLGDTVVKKIKALRNR